MSGDPEDRLAHLLQRGGPSALAAILVEDGVDDSRLALHLTETLEARGLATAGIEVEPTEDLRETLRQVREAKGNDVVAVVSGVGRLGFEVRDAFFRRTNLARDDLGTLGPSVILLPREVYRWIGSNTPDLLRWFDGPFEWFLPAGKPQLTQKAVGEVYRALDPKALSTRETFVPWPGSTVEIKRILAHLEWSHDFTTTIVVGGPGTGKSTLLRELGRSFEGRKSALVPVHVDVTGEQSKPLEKSVYISVHRAMSVQAKSLWNLDLETISGLVRSAAEEVGPGIEVVLLIDGLDHISTDTDQLLDATKALTRLPISSVVVLPSGFASVVAKQSRHFGPIFEVLTLAPNRADGGPNPRSREWLSQILASRLTTVGLSLADVFPEKLIDRLIAGSGGIPKTLLDLARQSLLIDPDQFPPSHFAVEASLQRAARNLHEMVDATILDSLLEVRRTGIVADPRLLDLGLVLHYQGDHSQFETHPLLAPLLDGHARS